MWSKFVNPFKYLPLRQAICWGIAALILTSIFFWQVGLRLTSITQLNLAGDRLWAATARQLIAWLLFAAILYIVGVVASKSKVRFIDVAAFNLFARIPMDLGFLMFAVPSVRSVTALASEGNINAVMQHIDIMTIVGLVSAIMSVWYFYWSYKAFAEATNVKNTKGVVLFIVSFIVCYIASAYALLIV